MRTLFKDKIIMKICIYFAVVRHNTFLNYIANVIHTLLYAFNNSSTSITKNTYLVSSKY